MSPDFHSLGYQNFEVRTRYRKHSWVCLSLENVTDCHLTETTKEKIIYLHIHVFFSLLQAPFPPLFQLRNKKQRSSTHSFMNSILIPFFKPGCTDYNGEGQRNLGWNTQKCMSWQVNPWPIIYLFFFKVQLYFYVFFLVCFPLKSFFAVRRNTLALSYCFHSGKWGMNMDAGEARILPMVNRYA